MRRPVNAEQRRVNRARSQEIADRKWRNHMRKMLVLFKGSVPSTSPWCTWVNDPFEKGRARHRRRRVVVEFDGRRQPRTDLRGQRKLRCHTSIA
jgi:hypothetical protein